MDQASHDAQAVFRQHFDDLTAQIRHMHAAWQEAVRVHDLAREVTLVAREHDLLIEIYEMITDYLERRAQRPQ